MNLTEAIHVVRPVVVQIRDGDGHVVGSGFFIDEEGHVATALHVVESAPSPSVSLAQPNTENMRGNFSGSTATLVAKDERRDLAILKMAHNPFRGEMRSGIVINGAEIELLYGTATLNVSRPDDGEPIAISGYPLANPVLVTTSGAIAAAWNYHIHEVPVPGAPDGFTMPEIADVYLADVQANPGNSGGPAIGSRMVRSSASASRCACRPRSTRPERPVSSPPTLGSLSFGQRDISLTSSPAPTFSLHLSRARSDAGRAKPAAHEARLVAA